MGPIHALFRDGESWWGHSRRAIEDRLAKEPGLQNAGFPDLEGFRDIEEARVVIIKNTAEMGVKYISQSLLPEIKDPKTVEVIGAPFELPFDRLGSLVLDFEL